MELEFYLFPLVPSQKAQLSRPKRLAQLDNQLCIRRETYSFFSRWKMVCMWATLWFSLEHIHINWLRDHTSWASCGIEMKIRGILKSWFWISLHQGTLSILCSRIQGYMLSLMNDVDPWLLLPLCVLYEILNHIFQQLVSERFSISCLYNMWLSF